VTTRTRSHAKTPAYAIGSVGGTIGLMERLSCLTQLRGLLVTKRVLTVRGIWPHKIWAMSDFSNWPFRLIFHVSEIPAAGEKISYLPNLTQKAFSICGIKFADDRGSRLRLYLQPLFGSMTSVRQAGLCSVSGSSNTSHWLNIRHWGTFTAKRSHL